MNNMNMQEAARVILGLRAAGWDEKEINDFILYVETGEEKYKPEQKKAYRIGYGLDKGGRACHRSPITINNNRKIKGRQ